MAIVITLSVIIGLLVGAIGMLAVIVIVGYKSQRKGRNENIRRDSE